MANYFDSVTEDLRKANGENEDAVIAALPAERNEPGDGASEDDAKEINLDCLPPQLSDAFSEVMENMQAVISDRQTAYMEHATAAVKEFIEEEEWHYKTSELGDDLVLFELGFEVRGINLWTKIYIEADPDACCIKAILPVSADASFEYPLCNVLAKLNYDKRFGSFKYDERDGEITFEYSFLLREGMVKDDLKRYLDAVISSAVTCYHEIRKYCVGRFKGKEVNEILKKVNALVDEISD